MKGEQAFDLLCEATTLVSPLLSVMAQFTSTLFPWLVLETLCGAFSLTFFADHITSMGGTPTTIGLFVAIRASSTALTTPLWGRVGNKYGKMRVVALLLSTGTLLTTLLEAFGPNLATYFVSRIVFGSTRAAATLANIYQSRQDINDNNIQPLSNIRKQGVVDNGQILGAIGYNSAGVGIGFLLGSMLGALTASTFGYHGAYLLNTCLALFTLAWAYFFVHEPTAAPYPALSRVVSMPYLVEPQISTWHVLKMLFFQPRLYQAFWVLVALIAAAYVPQHAYMEFMRLNLQFSLTSRAVLFFILGVVSILVQANMTRIIPGIFDEYTFSMGCLGLAAASNFLAPMGGSYLFVVTTLLGSIAGSITTYSLSKLVSISPSGTVGCVYGIYESVMNLSLVVGGVVCPAAFQVHSLLPFWMAAMVYMGLVPVLYWERLSKSRQQKHKVN